LRWGALATALALPVSAFAVTTGAGAATVRPQAPGIGHPTKALCVKKSYKIGYEVFQETQPFADLVSQSIKKVAHDLGCASVIEETDNLDGPTAVANVKTMINEGINGLIDFQVIASAQPAIQAALAAKHLPAVSTGIALPGWPIISLNDYNSGYAAGKALAKGTLARYPHTSPYLIVAGQKAAGATGIARANGDVNGVKSIYKSLPASHIKVVDTNGLPGGPSGSQAAVAGALSTIPSNALVIITGINDEQIGGGYVAAANRHWKHFLVESLGGDPYGLGQVCSHPANYTGAIWFNPGSWGKWLVPGIMDEINGYKLARPGIYIKGVNVDKAQIAAQKLIPKC
jgi:hypothetical protein